MSERSRVPKAVTVMACAYCLYPEPAVYLYIGDRAAETLLCAGCQDSWLHGFDANPTNYKLLAAEES